MGLVVVAFIASAVGTGVPGHSLMTSLAAVWEVETVQADRGPVLQVHGHSPAGQRSPFMEFATKQRESLSGHPGMWLVMYDGCNTHNASYTVDGEALTVTDAGQTGMLCVGGTAAERALRSAMLEIDGAFDGVGHAAVRWEGVDRLTITTAGHTMTLQRVGPSINRPDPPPTDGPAR